MKLISASWGRSLGELDTTAPDRATGGLGSDKIVQAKA